MSEKREKKPKNKNFTANTIDYNRIVKRNGEDRTVNRRRKISVDENIARSEDYIKSEPSYGTRRVDWSYYENKRKKSADNIETGRQHRNTDRKHFVTEEEHRRKIEQNKKRERIRRQRFRAAMIFLFTAAIAVVLLFMTPIFNIKEIKLEGNNVVTKEAIEEKIGYMIGSNLFSTRKSVIEKKMLEIAQISDVEVDKEMFPPSLMLTIEESSPAAYFLSGNTMVVINSDLKVIADGEDADTNLIPSLSGVSIQSYKLNKAIKTESEEKDEILHLMLSAFEKTGILKSVTYIGLDDISNIKFNYANRIEVLCGSQLELERKIRMFKEAINSDSVSNNAIGTVDLSVPGQAVYTP